MPSQAHNNNVNTCSRLSTVCGTCSSKPTRCMNLNKAFTITQEQRQPLLKAKYSPRDVHEPQRSLHNHTTNKNVNPCSRLSTPRGTCMNLDEAFTITQQQPQHLLKAKYSPRDRPTRRRNLNAAFTITQQQRQPLLKAN